MIVYLITSALVKPIVHEDGAADARSWFHEAGPAVSSVITSPETCAALSRHDRGARRGSARLDARIEALDARRRRVGSVRVHSQPAGRLALRHGLSGMEAVHLAAAVDVRERLLRHEADAELVFAAFKRRLLEAAGREGFAALGSPLG